MKTEAEIGAVLPGAKDSGRGEEGLPPGALGGSLPCQHLNFRLLAFETVREYVSVVEATQFVVICYSGPRTHIHPALPAFSQVGLHL